VCWESLGARQTGARPPCPARRRPMSESDAEAEAVPKAEADATDAVGDDAAAAEEAGAADAAATTDGATAATDVDPFANVKKNPSGGVLVTDREVEMAFKFFDAAGKGSVSKETIQERLALFPDAAEHGLQDLKGLESELTKKSLGKMLKSNKVTDFDPVAEAFKVLDPSGSGNIDIGVVRELFRGLGLGELTTDEINIIRKSGGNASGFITLEDFRGMLDEPDGPPM
jgi:calmodulin